MATAPEGGADADADADGEVLGGAVALAPDLVALPRVALPEAETPVVKLQVESAGSTAVVETVTSAHWYSIPSDPSNTNSIVTFCPLVRPAEERSMGKHLSPSPVSDAKGKTGIEKSENCCGFWLVETLTPMVQLVCSEFNTKYPPEIGNVLLLDTALS
jgi:hypothetical protein